MTKLRSYRGRFLMATTSSVFLLVLIYILGIKKTVTEVRTNRILIERLSWMKETQKKLSEFQRYYHIPLFDKGLSEGDKTGSHEKLLSKVATYVGDNNIRLIEFPAENISVSDQLVIRTSRVTCEGRFKDLVRLIDFLDRDSSLGVIRSADFFIYSDRRSSKSELRLRIVIENLSQSN